MMGHLFLRHFRSQMSPESSRQGHIKRVNPKRAVISDFFYYSNFVSFGVRMLR